MRQPAVPDQARRHLALSRQPDRPERAGLPVRQRIEARRRRVLVLETPVERGRIEVEDAPFLAVELDWTGDGRNQALSFRTNVDEVVTAGPDHPIRIAHDLLTCEPTPYIRLRDGDGRLRIEARIGRAVYYELVALAVPEWVGCRRMLGVWSRDKFFPLGEVPHCED